MPKYTIFVSSADHYHDLWPLFFRQLRKYWPTCSARIVLNTEVQDYCYPGLRLNATRVGKLGSFGQVFREGLSRVEDDYVLLMMIDYLLMGPVNEAALTEYFKAFIANKLDSLCLVANPYEQSQSIGLYDLHKVIPPSRDMFSFQIAFWKKSKLMQMVLPHETPWLAEWYGTRRANKDGIKLAYPQDRVVIPYLLEGALHKGRWVPKMVEYLVQEGYDIDFTERGLYEDKKSTIQERTKQRLVTCWPRLLSNIDLIRRSFIPNA